MSFTGQLGTVDSQPGNIVLGYVAAGNTAAFTGSGSLSVTSVVAFTGAAVFAGSGSLSATQTGATFAGTAALSGSGALSVTAVLTAAGSVSLSGSGALSGAGVAGYSDAGFLTAVGVLSVAGSRKYSFTPPTYSERPVTGERLTETRLKVTRGVSVLKNQDGSYSSITYPTTDDFAASLFVYQGGHVYPVSDAEAALLTAAGYGPNLT